MTTSGLEHWNSTKTQEATAEDPKMASEVFEFE